jgi:hypothetical protein
MFLPLEGKKMYEEILDQMQELLKDEIKNFSGDFGKLEQAVMAMMMSFGKGLLQRLLDCGPNGYKSSSVPCECGNSKKFVQHRSRDIHTLFGWVRLKRAYCNCRGCRPVCYELLQNSKPLKQRGLYCLPSISPELT